MLNITLKTDRDTKRIELRTAKTIVKKVAKYVYKSLLNADLTMYS